MKKSKELVGRMYENRKEESIVIISWTVFQDFRTCGIKVASEMAHETKTHRTDYF